MIKSTVAEVLNELNSEFYSNPKTYATDALEKNWSYKASTVQAPALGLMDPQFLILPGQLFRDDSRWIFFTCDTLKIWLFTFNSFGSRVFTTYEEFTNL